MIIKKYEDFEYEDEYFEYLETIGLISNGCARCMREFGICEDATRKYADREEFVYDNPMSDLDDPKRSYPVSCLAEWYGEDYVEEVKNRQE